MQLFDLIVLENKNKEFALCKTPYFKKLFLPCVVIKDGTSPYNPLKKKMLDLGIEVNFIDFLFSKYKGDKSFFCYSAINKGIFKKIQDVEFFNYKQIIEKYKEKKIDKNVLLIIEKYMERK